MSKSLCILLLVALVGVTQTHAKNYSKKGKTLVVLSHGAAAKGLLFSDAGYGFADKISMGTSLKTEKVGTVRGFFAFFPVPNGTESSQIGPAILTLPEGKIAYTCERFGVRATAYGVITGGTGRYAGASGGIVIVPFVDDNTIYKLTFNFHKAL